MNSYGDNSSARARAQVPGPSGASGDEDGPSGRASYLHPASGRPSGSASVGSASAGSASMGPASGGGRASGGAGRASVGSASVGGRAPVGSASAGRASVGSARVGGGSPDERRAGTAGRASVARAAVRPGAGYGPMEELGAPGRGGPPKSEAALKRAKRRRRANMLTAAAAVLVILLGTGVVGFTWFYDDVKLVEPEAETQSTAVLDASGKTIGVLGQTNRSVVPYQKINHYVKDAVMAAEDKNFLEHNGIDMKGIARAAWNNFTGGDTQGASTITQQYARHAAKMKEISYNRKLREAVLARKLESTYKKDQILGFYLNAVYFGRGANGVEAAAQAYFGKSVLTPVGEKGAITPAEAGVLASVIKQPEPVPGGHPGYDPGVSPQARQFAEERWNYTINNMLEKGWLKPAEKPAKYPVVRPRSTGCTANCGLDKPTGQIMKYVKQELLDMGITKEQWETGGFRITTTIDPKAQKAAEDAVDRENRDSPMSELKSTYKAAVVAINPANGRVIAYYGAKNSTDWDYAGLNFDPVKKTIFGGGRPPGSSFKIYTLLAGLKDGISFQTRWDSTKKNIRGQKINNSGRDPGAFGCDPVRCDLETATVQSYNFPFYWIADAVKPHGVLEAAHQAGINHIQTDNGKIIDLNKVSGEQLDKSFDREVGFGQYAVPLLEHANGIATIAADGAYNKAHFIRSVEQRDDVSGEFKPFKREQLKTARPFDKDQISDLDAVLEKIPGHNNRSLADGRPAIAKTGTWEFTGKGGEPGDNGDAWMVGATRQVAAAVWVGNEKVNKDGSTSLLPIKKPGGGNMTGGSVPGQIWKAFMDAANAAMNLPEESFPPRVQTGDPNHKAANGQPAPVQQQPQPCDNLFGIGCPDNGNNGRGNGNNGGFPGGGNGNGGDNGNGDNGNGGNNNGNGNGGNPNEGNGGAGNPNEGATVLPGPG
jgi:membrane peptidoglycan carboxypeptidase